MRISTILLYIACLCQFFYLMHESLFIYGLRPAMSQYAVFDIEPPLRNVIATSMFYILASPLAPVSGAAYAITFRRSGKRPSSLLYLSLGAGALLIVFDLWFRAELFEGVSFLG